MQSSEYINYIASNINKSHKYSEYISEQLRQYSEYISSNKGPIGISGSCGSSGVSGPIGTSGSCGSSGNSGKTYKNENKLPFLEIYEILPYKKDSEKKLNRKPSGIEQLSNNINTHYLYE